MDDLPLPTLSEILSLRKAWMAYKSGLWRKFRASLTPEQKQIFADYIAAGEQLNRLRRWEYRLQGTHKQPPWPARVPPPPGSDDT